MCFQCLFILLCLFKEAYINSLWNVKIHCNDGQTKINLSSAWLLPTVCGETSESLYGFCYGGQHIWIWTPCPRRILAKLDSCSIQQMEWKCECPWNKRSEMGTELTLRVFHTWTEGKGGLRVVCILYFGKHG